MFVSRNICIMADVAMSLCGMWFVFCPQCWLFSLIYTVAHKGHGKLFLSPQTHSVSRQAHFVLWETQSFSRQTIFVSFTGHFLTSLCSSQRTFLLHGTLHFFTAHFLPSRHAFSLHGTLSLFTAHFLSSRRTFFLHGTLSFFTAHFLHFTAHFLSTRHTFFLHGALSKLCHVPHMPCLHGNGPRAVKARDKMAEERELMETYFN